MHFLTPLDKLQESTWNGLDKWLKKFSASFLSMVFLLQGLLVRSSVGTTESTDILYFGVKVNLYGQTEY